MLWIFDVLAAISFTLAFIGVAVVVWGAGLSSWQFIALEGRRFKGENICKR